MSILASLSRAYDRLPGAPPYGYSAEKIGFAISLNEDGSLANLTDLRSGDGKKKPPRIMQVPQPAKRTVKIIPNLLWDKTSYSLGVSADAGERTPKEHAAFVERQIEIFGQSDDLGLKAFIAFLRQWSPEHFAPPLWPEEMKDQNVVFALEADRLQGVFLHDREAARALAAARVAPLGETTRALCLVTGIEAPIARLHPAIKNVWGAQSSGASIVSFNRDAFTSYGHEQGANAPVSEAAAFKYTTALNAFLAGRSNRIQIGDASTVFWADASDAEAAATVENVFASLCGEAPKIDEKVQAEKVGVVLKRIRDGEVWSRIAEAVDVKLPKHVRFYILGLAPNAARISVRYWFEDDFGVLAANYQRFLADIQVEPGPREGYPALWRYLNETAVLRKRENVVPTLAGDWMRSILAGTNYPLTLLSNILMRIRADGEINALRVGMLRAVLVRNFGREPGKGDKTREAPVALDLENQNKGYLLGRLFAAYEQAQTAALGRNVNATIKDKFYGSASATPRNVFSLLDRNSANHLSKVGKERPGQRVNLEKLIGGIMGMMAPSHDPFPASLNAEEQALFGLGYYHQRSEFFRKSESTGQGEA
ncbi:MAG: type I-C CRISPR-associated protein Cas8c/Csd1 [Rhizobiales bacterium]|nr:type I-C CRISPR-associated protein Cas8c/Csd1 [Hyphomicrobiales bacterium]